MYYNLVHRYSNFQNFTLSLQKINFTRKLKNKFSFLSFLLSLHNTNGSRVNGGGNGILFLCAVIDINDKAESGKMRNLIFDRYVAY